MARIPITQYMLLVHDEDLFDSGCQTLVNTVNTYPGVMGAGIAYQFATRYPDIVAPYKQACVDKTLTVNSPQLIKRDPLPWVLNFATKEHVKNKSQMEYIRNGLMAIKTRYKTDGIESIAIPALGCGFGGLDWPQVLATIIEYLGNIDIPCLIYSPVFY